MEKNQKKILIIAGIAGLLFILLIGWIFTTAKSRGTTNITLRVSPIDTTITLDGQQISAGDVKLKNGKHTLKGVRKDFDTTTKELDTDHITPDDIVYLILGASSDAAKQYLNDHPEEITIREGASGDQYNKLQDHLIDTYPFIQYLPYENLDLEIAYTTNEDQTISLQVTLKPISQPAQADEYKQELKDYQNEALQWMKDHGVNTDKTTISWSPDPNQ